MKVLNPEDRQTRYLRSASRRIRANVQLFPPPRNRRERRRLVTNGRHRVARRLRFIARHS